MEPFVTPEELAAFLRAPIDEASFLVLFAIDSACQGVREYTQRLINRVTETILIDGSGTDALLLPQRPTRRIIKVEQRQSLVFTSTYNEVTSDEWFVGFGDILYRSWPKIWPRGRGRIRLTYDHGWDLVPESGSGALPFDGVPSTLRLVALMAAKRIYLSQGDDAVTTGALAGEQIGSYSYQISSKAVILPAELTDGEKAILDRWAGKRYRSA